MASLAVLQCDSYLSHIWVLTYCWSQYLFRFHRLYKQGCAEAKLPNPNPNPNPAPELWLSVAGLGAYVGTK